MQGTCLVILRNDVCSASGPEPMPEIAGGLAGRLCLLYKPLSTLPGKEKFSSFVVAPQRPGIKKPVKAASKQILGPHPPDRLVIVQNPWNPLDGKPVRGRHHMRAILKDSIHAMHRPSYGNGAIPLRLSQIRGGKISRCGDELQLAARVGVAIRPYPAQHRPPNLNVSGNNNPNPCLRQVHGPCSDPLFRHNATQIVRTCANMPAICQPVQVYQRKGHKADYALILRKFACPMEVSVWPGYGSICY